jgi:hypothetical protein
MKEHSHDFQSVMMLQNCMGLIKVERDSDTEECMTSLDNGTEEGNIKIEELVDVKEENPEAIKFPPIKTEPEVSVWGLCETELHGFNQRCV